MLDLSKDCVEIIPEFWNKKSWKYAKRWTIMVVLYIIHCSFAKTFQHINQWKSRKIDLLWDCAQKMAANAMLECLKFWSLGLRSPMYVCSMNACSIFPCYMYVFYVCVLFVCFMYVWFMYMYVCSMSMSTFSMSGLHVCVVCLLRSCDLVLFSL